MTERTYDWNGQTHPLASPLSDIEVANKVRMLMRGDLDHECVCTMARDRIMALVKEKALLVTACEVALSFIERGGLELETVESIRDLMAQAHVGTESCR